MEIATGHPEQHPTPLPLNPAPAPDPVSPRFPGSDSPANAGSQVGGVRDTTGERLSQLAASEAEFAAAQSYGVSADGDRRGRYEASMNPLGASAGDAMVIPVVPSNAVPPAASDEYPYGGLEPTPADAGFAGEYGG